MRGDDEGIDPQDDPDYISEEGTGLPPLWRNARAARPSMGSPTPLFVPKTSTPLQGDGTDVGIPTFALWSMKYLRRAHLLRRAEREIRETFGEGDHAIHVLDDGRRNCLVSRKVGTSPDGCTYCLVAQIPIATYERLVDGASPEVAFSEAHTFSLCAVFEAPDAVSNVAVSARYAAADAVPPEYLPPNPPIAFEGFPEE